MVEEKRLLIDFFLEMNLTDIYMHILLYAHLQIKIF